MTGPTNDHDLTNALHQRADDFARLGGHDLDLAQVVSRAGEIRRGRRMRASMVMAAVVLAIAVPVGLAALGNEPVNPKPISPASSTTPDVDPISIDTTLKTGQPPRNGYNVGVNWIGPDKIIDLARPGMSDPISVAAIDGGLLVEQRSLSSDALTASYVDGSTGQFVNNWPIAGGFAVSYNGMVGAFAEPDGTVIAVQDAGTRWFEIGSHKLPTLPAGETYAVDSVWATNCSGRSDLTSCEINVHSSGQEPKAWIVSPNHDPVLDDRGFQKVVSVNGSDQAAGVISSTDAGTCSGVKDGNTMLWHSCDFEPIAFSPSGDYLLGRPASHDGIGDTGLIIVKSTTGEVVEDLTTAPNVALQQQVWDDSFRVLAAVFDHGRWAVERFDVNGSRELAVAATDDNGDLVSPYRLAISD